jgi:hypothetical protein
MTEMIIKTKRGVYGRVNITLPLTIKMTMLDWQKKSGMKKAEFLRMALTTGFLELSKGINASDTKINGKPDEGAKVARPEASARTDGLRPTGTGSS